MKKLFLVSVVLLFCLPSARANFMADPNRVESKGFAKFFYKKFDSSFGNELPSLHFDIPAPEKAYVKLFFDRVQRMGLKTPGGVLGSIEYTFKFQGTAHNPKAQAKEGPFRFIDFDDDKDLRREAMKLLKLRAPGFDQTLLNGLHVGLGFVVDGADLEAVVWEPKLKTSKLVAKFAPASTAKFDGASAGEIVLALSKSNVIRAEIRQLGIEAPMGAAPVVRQGGTDRILNADGSVRWLFHPEQFEDQAIDPVGRLYSEKVRAMTNLIPGVIEWNSYNDYSLMYP